MTSTKIPLPMTTDHYEVIHSAGEISSLTTHDDDIWFYGVGVVCSALCALGLVSNVISFVVWVAPAARVSACSPYFITLSVYDFFFNAAMLCSLCPAEIVFRVMEDSDLPFFQFFDPSSVFFPSFLNVVAFGSVYTTAVMAADRCLAVVLPLKWPRMCSVKKTIVALVVVLVWSVFTNVPIALEGQLEPVRIPWLNQTFLLFVETEYLASFFHTQVYLPYLFPAVSFVIPVVVILIINVVLVCTVRRRRKNVLGGTVQSSGSRDLNRLTLQVVIISLITLVSRCLYAVEYVMLSVERTIFVDQCSLACSAVSAVSKIALVINASINLFCYLYFAKKFRSLFLQRCRCFAACAESCLRGRQNGGSIPQSKSSVSIFSQASLTSLSDLSLYEGHQNVELKKLTSLIE